MSSPQSDAIRSRGPYLPPWAIQVAKLAFSAGLMWLLVSRIDAARFWAVARESSVPWLCVALLAYALVVLGASWRWRRLLMIQGVSMPFTATLESSVVALFFNNFLPTNIGGDVMRVRDSAGPAGSSTRATTVIVVDRVVGLVGLVLVAAIGAALSGERLPFAPIWIWAGLAAGVSGGTVALFLPSTLDRLIEPLTRLQETWLGSQLAAISGTLAKFRAQPAGLVEALALSVLVQMTSVGVYAAVAAALNVRVGLVDMALIVPLAALIQVLPFSINGIGLREAAFTVLLGRVGVPAEAALLVSLEATALILGFSMLGAGLYVLRSQATRDDVQPTAAVETG